MAWDTLAGWLGAALATGGLVWRYGRKSLGLLRELRAYAKLAADNTDSLIERADVFAKTLADHGQRIERLEEFTGMKPMKKGGVR